MNITSSVGEKGTNNPQDVFLVQNKLNQHCRINTAFKTALSKQIKMYSASKAIAADKICGAVTIDAIKVYQRIVMKWQSADGRIDPGGKTWKSLNGNVQSTTKIIKKSGKYTIFSQWDYSKTKVGNSTSSTIRQTGCTLTTLTMAATAIGSATEHWPTNLLPKDLNPIKANEIIKNAGGFNGGNMIVEKGANALGMKYAEYGRSTNLTAQELTILKSHLSKGYPVAAHVDYKGSDIGDHWILITKVDSDGSYSAIDPMFAGEVKLKKTANNNTRYKDERAKGKAGVLFGFEGGQDKKAGPKTQSGQQKYIVVRFGLLSPLKSTDQVVKTYTTSHKTMCTFNRGYGEFSLESFILNRLY